MYGLVILILASGLNWLLIPISTHIINDPEISYETPTFKDSSEKSAEQLKMFFTLTKHPYDTLKRPRHNNNPNDTSPVHVIITHLHNSRANNGFDLGENKSGPGATGISR